MTEPRRFKASELPLTTATRAAIESLAHAFKKEGAYDTIRKQVWDKFKASVRYLCLEVRFEELTLARTTKNRSQNLFYPSPNRKSRRTLNNSWRSTAAKPLL